MHALSARIARLPRSLFLAACVLAAAPLAAGCAGKGAGGKGRNAGKTQAQIDAERASAVRTGEAKSLIQLANEDLIHGRYMSAKRRAEEALATDPNNADAYAVLGASYWRAGDFRRSTEAFEKAIEIQPTNFGAIDGLGRNLQAIGQHERALELQDRLIAKEKEGFTPTACSDDGACSVGACDPATKMCQAPMQITPRVIKLWSQYLLADFDGAVKTTDEIFFGVGGDDGQLAVVRAFAGFSRPLAGKGPFIQIEGTSAKSDMMLDVTQGLRHISTSVGGEYARAVLLELVDESRIDLDLAKKLGLKGLGKFTPLGMAEESEVVIVPEIEIKGIKIKNVPAIAMDLSTYEGGVGERPGMILGRQVLHRFGAITFDHPAGDAIFEVAVPSGPPTGAVEVPLLMLDMHTLHIPAIEMGIDGSDHRFWVWLGGIYQTGYTLAAKSYLKSGHRPREITPPDEESLGLRMVMFDSVTLGGKAVDGAGGFVMTNTPPDQQIADVLAVTAFELGGYVNMTAMKPWKVTYVLSQGKAYLAIPGAR